MKSNVATDRPGTYALLIDVPRRMTIPIGRGRRRTGFDIGTACYVGSAFGPGGLVARLRRHASTDKKLHWHVDWLLRRARLTAAMFVASEDRRECAWARWFDSHTEACVRGFGSSDCSCPGHLFHLGRRASAAPIIAEARTELRAEFVTAHELRQLRTDSLFW
jgi:Uri superfamily endonuclease